MVCQSQSSVWSFRTKLFGDMQLTSWFFVFSFLPVDASGNRCNILVAKYPPDGFSMEAWYNIWVAGVDVFTTCIQRGMTGGVYELGMCPPPISLATSYLSPCLCSISNATSKFGFFLFLLTT